MLKTRFWVGLEIAVFTNTLFTSGYWLLGPSILSQIGGIGAFGGLLATAPPETLGSIGLAITMSSITLSPGTIWLAELRTFEKCQWRCRVPYQIKLGRRRQPLLASFGRMDKESLVRKVANKNGQLKVIPDRSLTAFQRHILSTLAATSILLESDRDPEIGSLGRSLQCFSSNA